MYGTPWHRCDGPRSAADFGCCTAPLDLKFAFRTPEYGPAAFGDVFRAGDVPAAASPDIILQYRRLRVCDRRAWVVRIDEGYKAEVRFVDAVASVAPLVYTGGYESYRSRCCRCPEALRPVDFLAHIARIAGPRRTEAYIRAALVALGVPTGKTGGPFIGCVFSEDCLLNLSSVSVDTAFAVGVRVASDVHALYQALCST